jgi:transcriptional regulator with XRE-family HTH domain
MTELRGAAIHNDMFGKLIRSLRKEHRDEAGAQWTQQPLASKTGVEKRTIERIEQGAMRRLELVLVLRLADALELMTMERKEFFSGARPGKPESGIGAQRSERHAQYLILCSGVGQISGDHHRCVYGRGRGQYGAAALV